MSIYIKGMGLPKNHRKMILMENGDITDIDGRTIAKAIELPPHGRLGDLDAMMAFVDAGHLRNPLELSWSDADVESMIDSRPTIIPAEGGDT